MAQQRRKEVPKAAVKKAYVEGTLQTDGTFTYPTTVQLAEQFGVARETISRWINREGWETDRALYQERLEEAASAQKAKRLAAGQSVEQATAEVLGDLRTQGVSVATPEEVNAGAPPGVDPGAKIQIIAGERAKFDTTCLTLAKALQAEVAVTITQSRKKVQDVTTAATPAPSQLAPKELLSLAGTLERAQRIGRLALGQTTENQGVSAPDGAPVNVKVTNGHGLSGLLAAATGASPKPAEVKAISDGTDAG